MNYVLDSSKAHHKYFEELCYIPHPPFQEKALSEYVIAFAKERGLWYYTDSLYNVVVKKPATPRHGLVERREHSLRQRIPGADADGWLSHQSPHYPPF